MLKIGIFIIIIIWIIKSIISIFSDLVYIESEKDNYEDENEEIKEMKNVITNICCEIMENTDGKITDIDFSSLFEYADHDILNMP